MLDREFWEEPEDRISPRVPLETLSALDARLRFEHASEDHGGQRPVWLADEGGIYCADCFEVGRNFNLRPFKRFVRVSDECGDAESVEDIPYITI
jgi:hypothetical protein